MEGIPAYLPHGAALKDAVQKARDWLRDVEALQVGQRRPRGAAVGRVSRAAGGISLRRLGVWAGPY